MNLAALLWSTVMAVGSTLPFIALVKLIKEQGRYIHLVIAKLVGYDEPLVNEFVNHNYYHGYYEYVVRNKTYAYTLKIETPPKEEIELYYTIGEPTVAYRNNHNVDIDAPLSPLWFLYTPITAFFCYCFLNVII